MKKEAEILEAVIQEGVEDYASNFKGKFLIISFFVLFNGFLLFFGLKSLVANGFGFGVFLWLFIPILSFYKVIFKPIIKTLFKNKK